MTAILVAGTAVACTETTRAATEFCPAELIGPYAKSPGQPSASQYYYLRALGPRMVEGTVVADTDAGWFTWNQATVPLTRATWVTTGPRFKTRWVVADSAPMQVTFPKPVYVRHAWVSTAQTHGEMNFNWDSYGEVACEPPAFAPSTVEESKSRTERDAGAGDPTPGPNPPAATAMPTSAPFTIASCAHPFVPATVTRVSQPDFPESMRGEGLYESVVADIYVAIDPHGKLADAWILASSGYPAIDREALLAARRSQYSGAVSYCRPVSGTYVFRAEFEPY